MAEYERLRDGQLTAVTAESIADLPPALIHLGPRAFDLLVALVQSSGRLATKDKLLARVWGKVVVEDNALQAHISALGKVLGADAITTVPGQGYRFAIEAQALTEPWTAEPPRRHNLPQPLTSFIGREREIAEVRRWLDVASSRLLTLTGAGGCGKTRLALQVAGASINAYPDGVWLVELAALGDPTLIVQAVAKALAIDAPGQDIVETVVEWLRPRHVLLVLDNAEHLLEACARLADRVLRQCAGVQILTTSRERLGIDGELTYRVPSLSVPGGKDAEDVLACEAAQVFIDRAHLQRQDIEPTGKDTAALALRGSIEICHWCSLPSGHRRARRLERPRPGPRPVVQIEDSQRQAAQDLTFMAGGRTPAASWHR